MGIATLGALGLAGVLTLGGVVAAASADSGRPAGPAPGASASASADRPRTLATACDHLPDRIAKVEKVQGRLHGDAATKGSIAHLESRVARAEAQGRADEAQVLSDRLAVRRDLDARLPGVLAHLRDAQKICAGRVTASAT